MTIGDDRCTIPRPFEAGDLPRNVRAGAQSLWHWFDTAPLLVRDGSRSSGHPALAAAVETCRAFGLDDGLLGSRVEALRKLADGYRPASGMDLDALADALCGDHARLLAGLTGLTGSWQRAMAGDLGRGFLLTGTIVCASRLGRGAPTLFPAEDLDRFGVSEADLCAGEATHGVRRLLWKQAVRARDALAAGRPVIEEMPGLLAFRARRYWFGALELLVRAERHDWDVWRHPPVPDGLFRLRVLLMSAAGRTVFRR